MDIFFDIQERKDYLFGNFLLVGKQYMNNFRCTGLESFLGKRLNEGYLFTGIEQVHNKNS